VQELEATKAAAAYTSTTTLTTHTKIKNLDMNAQVADMRSGKERAVRVSKRSRRIKHGNILQGFKLSTLATIWTVCDFLVNFMYSSVH
jgi:hypothetical protein